MGCSNHGLDLFFFFAFYIADLNTLKNKTSNQTKKLNTKQAYLFFHNFEQSFGTPHFSELTVVLPTNIPFGLISFEQSEYFSARYANTFALFYNLRKLCLEAIMTAILPL